MSKFGTQNGCDNSILVRTRHRYRTPGLMPTQTVFHQFARLQTNPLSCQLGWYRRWCDKLGSVGACLSPPLAPSPLSPPPPPSPIGTFFGSLHTQTKYICDRFGHKIDGAHASALRAAPKKIRCVGVKKCGVTEKSGCYKSSANYQLLGT